MQLVIGQHEFQERLRIAIEVSQPVARCAQQRSDGAGTGQEPLIAGFLSVCECNFLPSRPERFFGSGIDRQQNGVREQRLCVGQCRMIAVVHTGTSWILSASTMYCGKNWEARL